MDGNIKNSENNASIMHGGNRLSFVNKFNVENIEKTNTRSVQLKAIEAHGPPVAIENSSDIIGLEQRHIGGDRKITNSLTICSGSNVTDKMKTIDALVHTVPLAKKLFRRRTDYSTVIGIRNKRNADCLSQQIRAISSPTLTGTLSADTAQNDFLNVHLTLGEPNKSVDTPSLHNDEGNSATFGGNTFGVLHKFRRTLQNLNSKNQIQVPSTANNGDSKSASTICNGTPFQSALVVNTTTDKSVFDTGSARHRFGPLIWRSSKERRKTKFNRRDKCNSGDSGIQIEIEPDEHYIHTLNKEQHVAINGLRKASKASNANTCTIRRSQSAKAKSIVEQENTINKHRTTKIGSDYNLEREAPEPLPTRSFSQPNGLEMYGIRHTENEDTDSDSVASQEDANSYIPIYAEVLYNFNAAGPQELGLEKGDLIEILRKEVGPWWFGRFRKEHAGIVEEILDPELGWFPKDFVRIIQSHEVDSTFVTQNMMLQDISNSHLPVPVNELNNSNKRQNDREAVDKNNITTIVIESSSAINVEPETTINVPRDNCALLQYGAVRELLETEVSYVKLLAAICDGFLPAMSKRIDIFSPSSVRLIFSNITAIYEFQRQFLQKLRLGIHQNQLAKVFLKMHKGFICYSTYCNAYPRALIELESYERSKDARIILENCRESQNLAELPLSAHLLAPVQRICRYPLHLNELIKTVLNNNFTEDKNEVETDVDILDVDQVDISQINIPDTQANFNLALEKMRGVTEAVNEGKRHSETIARHQASFQQFKGPPLHLYSTRFFLQIDATRQKQNLWNSSCTLFLFDNQLVYCKRDIIKRSQFIYKGRIFLDRCRIMNIRDGKMFGHTIKNSLRIYCESRNKWYDFSFRSANRKHRFLNTLALERQFGGKTLHVSEMTGYELNYAERQGDYSDQSDLEQPEYEQMHGGTSASGDSSVPESPVKSPHRSCDTLPKKSQSRDAIATSINVSNQYLMTTSTGSLGRRRIGNWFRKPKSSNCTPSQSPTHKPDFDADLTLTAARVAAIEMLTDAKECEESSLP